MKYCDECGHELIERECGIDGKVPYCEECHQYKFPMFNSAISAIVFNKERDKILLIQQYGSQDNILIAGYINKGENAKETLIREIKEEVNLNVIDYIYNDNEYFQKTNTLIHNYAAVVDSESFELTDEVDQARWVSIDDVLKEIKPNSLAKSFVERYLNNIKNIENE